jgi:hypothetical protein
VSSFSFLKMDRASEQLFLLSICLPLKNHTNIIIIRPTRYVSCIKSLSLS